MRTYSNLLKPTQTLKNFSPGVSCEAEGMADRETVRLEERENHSHGLTASRLTVFLSSGEPNRGHPSQTEAIPAYPRNGFFFTDRPQPLCWRTRGGGFPGPCLRKSKPPFAIASDFSAHSSRSPF